MDRGTRRRLGSLTVALIVVLPLSVLAARWQWNRHLERDALNAAVTRSQQTPPVPLQHLLPAAGLTRAVEWRRVTATGHWQTATQWLVRRQVVNGEVGFTVLNTFETDDGLRLYVLRGWIPDAGSEVPAVPEGESTITLRVRMPQGDGPIRPSDLPSGQINRADPSALDALISSGSGARSLPAVFELVEPVPPGLVALPLPELTSGPHVSYFVQWILIGITAVVVYIRVFRIELKGQRDDAGGDDPDPGSDDQDGQGEVDESG